MSFPQQVKNSLLQIISDMSSNPNSFFLNPKSDFSRKRKLPFASLIHLMLSMEAGTIRDELLDYFSLQHDTLSNSAFFQQRNKLSQTVFPHIFYSFDAMYPHSLYKGKYLLLAADGSSFTFTRNPLDEASYYQPTDKSSNGYNQIHVVPLFHLLDKRYLDCVIQPVRRKNEFQALCDLIDRHPYASGQIPVFIADRGFHSLNVFAHAIEHNAYFIIRATDRKMNNLLNADLLKIKEKDNFDIWITRFLTRSRSKKKRQHPERAEQYKVICKDVSFDYLIPGRQNEYEINLRVLRFKISENGYENIITNLPSDEFSPDEIKHLYNLRWGIETSFRELKHVIGARNFHSKNRKYIEMEIWARLILYNYCSIITGHVVVAQKNNNKHIYQVNYSVAYKACHYFFRLHLGESPPDVEGLIGKNILPIRPNRNYARQHRFRVPVSFTYRFK